MQRHGFKHIFTSFVLSLLSISFLSLPAMGKAKIKKCVRRDNKMICKVKDLKGRGRVTISSKRSGKSYYGKVVKRKGRISTVHFYVGYEQQDDIRPPEVIRWHGVL